MNGHVRAEMFPFFLFDEGYFTKPTVTQCRHRWQGALWMISWKLLCLEVRDGYIAEVHSWSLPGETVRNLQKYCVRYQMPRLTFEPITSRMEYAGYQHVKLWYCFIFNIRPLPTLVLEFHVWIQVHRFSGFVHNYGAWINDCEWCHWAWALEAK